MPLTFQDSLTSLGRLSASRLDETTRRIRSSLADAEWKMSICLLAMVRTGGFRKLGFATISEYAEKALNLSGKKLAWLLGAARALEHLPLLSEAFKKGEIGWGKVRALQSLATPETEKQWLDFAIANTTELVAKKVALSPTSWKRHRALKSSLKKEPVSSVRAVQEVLQRRMESSGGPTCNSPRTVPEMKESPSVAIENVSQKIRMVVEFTPDQYALYEAAERRVRSQTGKCIARAEVLTKMSEVVLAQGTARARARHQVLIHTCDSCQSAWYETDQGVRPVNPEVLGAALSKAEPLRVDELSQKDSLTSMQQKSLDETPLKSPRGNEQQNPGMDSAAGREHIPNATLRQLFARAGNCCERCQARGVRLEVHHVTPVCEGGSSELEELRLFCKACHTLHHEKDVNEKPLWRRARMAAMGKNPGGRCDKPPSFGRVPVRLALRL